MHQNDCDVRPYFFQFRERVCLGDTYADSVAVGPERPETSRKVFAERYWRQVDGWGFLLKGDRAVLVPHNNISFVYGEAGAVQTEGNGHEEKEAMGNEKVSENGAPPLEERPVDQNGFPVSMAQAAYADIGTGEIAERQQSERQAQPKRRGRPPKIRPEA